jgi:hypothetical protein
VFGAADKVSVASTSSSTLCRFDENGDTLAGSLTADAVATAAWNRGVFGAADKVSVASTSSSTLCRLDENGDTLAGSVTTDAVVAVAWDRDCFVTDGSSTSSCTLCLFADE